MELIANGSSANGSSVTASARRRGRARVHLIGDVNDHEA
jgi:hypothetical protein